MNLEVFLVAVSLAGAVVGCLTGLFPGLHVNTLAVLLVASAPASAALAPLVGLDPVAVPLAVGSLVLAITIAHTYVNIVPATYLGAPDEATSLSVLPAHRLLLRGHGYRAVVLSMHGSHLGVLVSLLVAAPLAWFLLGPPALWGILDAGVWWLLVAMVLFLVWREPALLGPETYPRRMRRLLGRIGGSQLLLASGLFGLLSFRLPYQGILPVPASALLPALSGLFGAATLIEALTQSAKIPHQFLRLQEDRVSLGAGAAAVGVGVAAGAGMSLLPGLTNSTATAVAGSLRKTDDAQTLVSLGAVQTANAVFNLLVLYLLGRSRSGSVVALEQLVPVDPWTGAPPSDLAWFLFATLAAAVASLGATMVLGKWAARRVHRVPYGLLVRGVLLYVTLVVAGFTGWFGLLVFLVGAALGMVPVRLGLQRTHLTGVLLVPVLIWLWP